MRARSGLRRALGEPLLQFLAIGALLFAGYRLVHPERPAKVEGNRIELTAADLRQLEIVWAAQWRRAPTQDELQGLVESRVREEILYREALALGLERGDTIIKRRLAQKMEFLADDLSTVRTPSVEELHAWYSRNSARFTDPGRRSFRHLYFSADRRGDHASQDAARALAKLGSTPSAAPAFSAIGDAFMFQEHYGDRTPEQVATIFGSRFAEAVRQLAVGTWQGPIESGLGWHLVLVTSATPGRVPAFDEIEAEIQAAWMEDQRLEARRRGFDVMKARYEVRVPALSRAHNETSAPAPTATP
jgi:peptidyl-prolyl cis-trans isomerase C